MKQEPIKLTKQGIIDTACRPGKSEDDLTYRGAARQRVWRDYSSL